VSTSADHARLAYTVHEVRSPVAALAALAEAVAGAGGDVETVRRLVDLASAACHAIGRVLDDAVLDVELLDGVDVAQIARDATQAAALGGARVRLEVGPGTATLSADPVRLRQALDNLIANAVLYGAEGGEVLVRIDRDPEAGLVHVSVANAGEGIPPGERERIFEPGVRLNVGRPGWGIGLAVVWAVAESHGGTVSVESAPGDGAMFTISLPVARR
jgi:signal transduction histidine kinase